MLDRIFSLDVLWWLLLLLYIPACFGLIIIVLLQKGKGVGFAGAFGVGAGSEAVFGPRTAKSLPQKLTYTAAGLFMFLALVMSTLSGHVGKGSAPSLVTPDTMESQDGGTSGTMPSLFGQAPGTPAPEVGVISDPEAQVDLTTGLDVQSQVIQPIVPENPPAEAATAPAALQVEEAETAAEAAPEAPVAAEPAAAIEVPAVVQEEAEVSAPAAEETDAASSESATDDSNAGE